jgi:hypothetical protein
MKTRVLGLVSLVFFATNIFAQTSYTTAEDDAPRAVAARGFRVALVKPILDLQVETNTPAGSFLSASDDFNDALGLSVGYASLPVQRLGGLVNLAYFRMTSRDEDIGLARLDASLAYAIVENIYVKGGANVTKFTGNPNLNDADPGIGWQAGAGVQFNPHLGIDVSWVEMNQSLDANAADVDFKESGPEFNVNGTF